MKHTKPPFIVNCGRLFDSKGRIVANCNGLDIHNRPIPVEEARANAEFLSRASLTHYELVAIATQALYFEKAQSQDMDGQGTWSTTDFEIQIEDVLKRAKEKP